MAQAAHAGKGTLIEWAGVDPKSHGPRHPESPVFRQMWRRQRGRCVYCRLPLKYGFQVDHIVPRSRGGRAHISNYQLLCWHCNGLKGDRTDREFRIYLPEWRNWFRGGRKRGFVLKPEAHLRTRRWWSVYKEAGGLLDPSQYELSFVSQLLHDDERFSWYEAEDDDLTLVWTRGVNITIKLTRCRWLQVHFKKDFQRLGSQQRYSQLSPRLRGALIYETAEREERRYQRDSDAVWEMVITGEPFCWYQRDKKHQVAVYRRGRVRLVEPGDWRNLLLPWGDQVKRNGYQHCADKRHEGCKWVVGAL